jgi:FkbM family methyltransferase
MLAGRPTSFVLRQLFEAENYRAMLRIRRVAVHPLDFASRYLLGRGSFPAAIPLRTPAGIVAPTAYTHHDVITANEIFCRLDYRLAPGARVVVDVGSNIGISALYFLTASPLVRCHLFEPDPRNLERLRANLAAYTGRYVLTAAAVGDSSGRARFGREPSGRYGGLESDHGEQIEVDCLHIDEVLTGVLEREGRVDMLKIDTEGLENRTVAAIRPDLLAEVGVICFETREPFNPSPELFDLSYATETARLERRTPRTPLAGRGAGGELDRAPAGRSAPRGGR